MKILYIYRNNNAGPSIRRVFEPVEDLMSKMADVTSIKVPYYKMVDIFKNIAFVKGVIKKERYDIIHITGDVYYLVLLLSFFRKKSGYKIVVTVHDLGHYTQHKHSLMHLFYYWLWIKPIKKADHITFISKKSYNEGRDVLKVNDNITSVVYNPYNIKYEYYPEPNNPLPVILHIGTKPNKNLENVVRSLNGINCKLRIIGKLNSLQEQMLRENRIDYSQQALVSDEQILEEYKDCNIVSFPSFYEGFGMPIIEGQAVGRVVVTSNREPMIDISDGTTILVNPNDIEDIRRGFLLAISSSLEYINAGLTNVLRFSPKKITGEYFKIYCDLIKE